MQSVDWTAPAMFWATVAVALISAGAALFNFLVFRTQIDPEVIVYTKHDDHRSTIIMLVIENIGKGVAYDIRFKFSEPLPAHAFGWEETDGSDVKYMKDGPLISGIPALPPGQKRELDWGQYVGLTNAIKDRRITITATYTAAHFMVPGGFPMSTESLVDIRSYLGTNATDRNYGGKIVKELEKLGRSMDRLVSGVSDVAREIEDRDEQGS
jgi:hypothetical protein